MRLFLMLLCFGYIYIGLAQNTHAEVMVPHRVEENVARSDIVALLQIEEATAVRFKSDLCGYRYKSKIVRLFKAGNERSYKETLEFGRVGGLDVGNYYVVFIKYSDNLDEYYDDFIRKIPTSSKHDIINEIKLKGTDWGKNMAACGGLVPGPEYDSESAWSVYDDTVIIEGILPQPFPGEIHVRAHEGLRSIIDARSLFLYLERLSKR